MNERPLSGVLITGYATDPNAALAAMKSQVFSLGPNGEGCEVVRPIIAERRAGALLLEHAGAVVFCRTGNPAKAFDLLGASRPTGSEFKVTGNSNFPSGFKPILPVQSHRDKYPASPAPPN